MTDTNAALETLAEFDECAQCRTVFAITLAAMGATVMLERDSNARMVLELQLAAVEAEIV